MSTPVSPNINESRKEETNNARNSLKLNIFYKICNSKYKS